MPYSIPSDDMLMGFPSGWTMRMHPPAMAKTEMNMMGMMGFERLMVSTIMHSRRGWKGAGTGSGSFEAHELHEKHGEELGKTGERRIVRGFRFPVFFVWFVGR